MLDLIFTNDPLVILDVLIYMSLCTSYQDSVVFNIYIPITGLNTLKTEPVTKKCWQNGDWDTFALFYNSVDWINLFAPCKSANDC